MPKDVWFKLTVPEAGLRKLKRKDYYAVRSWLRLCERAVAERTGVEREPYDDRIHRED